MLPKRINGVYVSSGRFENLRDKIKEKSLTDQEFLELTNGSAEKYRDVGGRFIRWERLANGRYVFKQSAQVEEVDPPFRKSDSY